MLEAAGTPSPLKRLSRFYKWNTQFVIPDDGFVILLDRIKYYKADRTSYT